MYVRFRSPGVKPFSFCRYSATTGVSNPYANSFICAAAARATSSRP
jgi:hypothetical protein